MIGTILAFARRDFLIRVSYRFAMFLEVAGFFTALVPYYFLSGIVRPGAFGAGPSEYFPHVVVGIAVQSFMSVGLYAFSTSLRGEQASGTLEALLLTPHPPSRLILVMAAPKFARAGFIAAAVLAAGAAAFGMRIHPEGLPAAAAVLLAAGATFAGIGILAGSFILVAKRGEPATWFLSAASALFSGVYYPVEALPPLLRAVSACLPLTYALRGTRTALLAGVGGWREAAVLAAFAAVLIPVSLVAFRLALARSLRDGTLLES